MGQIERYGKKKDLKRIRLTLPNGKRKRLHLGNMTVPQVKKIDQHCDSLISSCKHGVSIAPDTEVWLDGVTDDLREKLQNLGLIKSRENLTLGSFTKEYISNRTDIKSGTILQLNYARNYLITCFDENKSLRDFNRGDAEKFRIFLTGQGLSEPTLRRHCGRARQFFNAALKKELVSYNPFDEIKVTVKGNRNRMHFVTIEEAMRTMEALPNAEWRALFALCRFGGLRCISEVLKVRWIDIHWSENRMTVWSPKTEHHPNGESRIIPLWYELRKYLSEWQEYAPDGSEHVIHNIRASSSYLRKIIIQSIERAGLKPWPKIFQNLRSSRQTELSDAHPAKAVCEWMGNSIDVANEHYLQVTDQHFENALQFRVIEKGPNLRPESDITGQNRGDSGNIEKNEISKRISNEPTIQADAEPCGVKKESSEKRLLSSSSPARI